MTWARTGGPKASCLEPGSDGGGANGQGDEDQPGGRSPPRSRAVDSTAAGLSMLADTVGRRPTVEPGVLRAALTVRPPRNPEVATGPATLGDVNETRAERRYLPESASEGSRRLERAVSMRTRREDAEKRAQEDQSHLNHPPAQPSDPSRGREPEPHHQPVRMVTLCGDVLITQSLGLPGGERHSLARRKPALARDTAVCHHDARFTTALRSTGSWSGSRQLADAASRGVGQPRPARHDVGPSRLAGAQRRQESDKPTAGLGSGIEQKSCCAAPNRNASVCQGQCRRRGDGPGPNAKNTLRAQRLGRRRPHCSPTPAKAGELPLPLPRGGLDCSGQRRGPRPESWSPPPLARPPRSPLVSEAAVTEDARQLRTCEATGPVPGAQAGYRRDRHHLRARRHRQPGRPRGRRPTAAPRPPTKAEEILSAAKREAELTVGKAKRANPHLGAQQV